MGRDEASILDALIFAKQILEFTTGMNQESFAANLKTQYAVLYQITVLGEALRRISSEFQQQHPEIPYREVIGMRNKLVHDYDDVNIPLVWQVIETSIPDLIVVLERIVPLEEP